MARRKGIALSLADKVRVLNDGAGITQRELAARFGVSERTIRRWKSGEVTKPSSRTAASAQKLSRSAIATREALFRRAEREVGRKLPRAGAWPGHVIQHTRAVFERDRKTGREVRREVPSDTFSISFADQIKHRSKRQGADLLYETLLAYWQTGRFGAFRVVVVIDKEGRREGKYARVAGFKVGERVMPEPWTMFKGVGSEAELRAIVDRIVSNGMPVALWIIKRVTFRAFE